MYVVAIVGGLGSGKSRAAARMAELGATVLDADVIAREVVDRDPEVCASLVAGFGEGILEPDGSVCRPALARIAFASAQNTELLDAAVHPRVLTEIRRRIHGFRDGDPADAPQVLAIEIPLIHKVPELLDEFDEIVALTAPRRQRVGRAVERGMEMTDALRRVEAQPPDHERVRIADTVIPNEDGTGELIAQIDRWWSRHEESGWRSVRMRTEDPS